ncbi:MAG: hypothetical protein ACRCX2_04505 [Paraclostridium sp.]
MALSGVEHITVYNRSFKLFEGVYGGDNGYNITYDQYRLNDVMYHNANVDTIVTLVPGINTIKYLLKNNIGLTNWWSGTRSVTYIDNRPPTTTLTNRNLGRLASWSNVNYSISDENNHDMTVIEKLDNSTILRNGTYGNGTSLDLGMTNDIFNSLSYGVHTIVVTITDTRNDSITVTVTFNKVMMPIGDDSSLKEVMDRFELINNTLVSSYSVLSSTLESKGLTIRSDASLLELVESVDKLPSMTLE